MRGRGREDDRRREASFFLLLAKTRLAHFVSCGVAVTVTIWKGLLRCAAQQSSVFLLLAFCFLLFFHEAGEVRFGLALAFSRHRESACCRSWCGRVAFGCGGAGVNSGGYSASTAALLVLVFALALLVFVVRIHRTACALLL